MIVALAVQLQLHLGWFITYQRCIGPMPGKDASTSVDCVPLRKLYAGVVLVLAALVTQDVLLLLWSILGVKVIFTVYIFFTDAADSMFMVGPHPPLMCTIHVHLEQPFPVSYSA